MSFCYSEIERGSLPLMINFGGKLGAPCTMLWLRSIPATLLLGIGILLYKKYSPEFAENFSSYFHFKTFCKVKFLSSIVNRNRHYLQGC